MESKTLLGDRISNLANRQSRQLSVHACYLTVQQGAQSNNTDENCSTGASIVRKRNIIRGKNIVPDGALSILEKNHCLAAKISGLAFHRW